MFKGESGATPVVGFFIHPYDFDKMRLTNYSTITPDTPMAELVLSNPYGILMLEHFEVDLMLQEKTVAQVCAESGISLELFLSVAQLFNGGHNFPNLKFQLTDVHHIISYLKHCHYYYTEEKYPQIKAYIQLLKKFNPAPEIIMLERFFQEYFNEVKEHLEYENNSVFPYVTALLDKLDGRSPQISFSEYEVSDYKDHHDNIEEKLSDLKNLLIKYLPAQNDRQVRRKLLFSLSELEFDLHIHSEIEDLILVPLVEQIENELKRKHEK